MQRMVVLTRKERTKTEFDALLAAAGLELACAHPTSIPGRTMVGALPLNPAK